MHRPELCGDVALAEMSNLIEEIWSQQRGGCLAFRVGLSWASSEHLNAMLSSDLTDAAPVPRALFSRSVEIHSGQR